MVLLLLTSLFNYTLMCISLLSKKVSQGINLSISLAITRATTTLKDNGVNFDGLVVVGGNFIVKVLMYGLGAAMAEAPFNLVQMSVAGIVGVPVSIAVKDRLRL